jgi:3-hydroxybutyryl-CoA dehydrogenase
MNEVIGVIGGGTMGAGIAQVAAACGHVVRVLEVDVTTAERAIAGIGKRFARLVEKGKLTGEQAEACTARLHPSATPADLGDCAVVIEAIVENMDAKVAVLSRVLTQLNPAGIIASNTSSLSVSQLGEQLGVPGRVCGMHFFNPAPLMPLVEVIAGRDSSPDAVQHVFDLAVAWGKTAVRVKDTPGFIVNRVARPYYLEALRIVAEGGGDPFSIDLVMKEVGGFRMGPFELMDLVGIDINYAVTCSVYEQSGEPSRFKPSPIQAALVEQGKLGRKTGEGVYVYDNDEVKLGLRAECTGIDMPAAVSAAWDDLATAGDYAIKPESGYVFARILCTLMNEAALAAQEGVATDADIDLAMQKGTNYPRGLLAWAASLGHTRVGAMLTALNDTVDDGRFRPAQRFLTV